MSLCRAIRVAQMLGLHRVDGDGIGAIPLLPSPRDWTEAEERRRTWWVIYCSDRLVSGSTGWPALINEQDVGLSDHCWEVLQVKPLLTCQQIQTRLPSSEKAFEEGLEEHTSHLTSILHQEGQNFSAFAGRVLAATVFYLAFKHSTQIFPEDDVRNIKTGMHWKRHRQVDNDLVALLQGLPDDLRLPGRIRCQNATFINLIIHTSIICLHRAALSKLETLSLSDQMIRQSRARLMATAEEMLSIFRMMPDVVETLKNPMLTFAVYSASLVFLNQPISTETDCQQQDNLDFVLRLMILAERTWSNPVTGSMAIQLSIEMRQRGLTSAAVEKVTGKLLKS